MDFKRRIKFDIVEVSGTDLIEFDGIQFSNFAYIKMFIDGVDIFSFDLFQGSFLVFKELNKSSLSTGEYLIFTGVSGIADDAGWDYIEVIHLENVVTWNIQRDDNLLSYTFDKDEYINQVTVIGKKIKNTNEKINLEPIHVIYPE